MDKTIITGFARSGTSFLAKFLHEVGFDIDGSWNDKSDAGFENDLVSIFVTALLVRPLNDGMILKLQKFIEKIENPIVKHPRFLYNSDSIRIWKIVWPNTNVICCYREPYHALESKKKFKNFGFYDLRSPRELDNLFHSFISTLIDLRIKHNIIYFPDYLDDYYRMYHILESLDLQFDYDEGKKIWESMVDKGKVHFY